MLKKYFTFALAHTRQNFGKCKFWEKKQIFCRKKNKHFSEEKANFLQKKNKHFSEEKTNFLQKKKQAFS